MPKITPANLCKPIHDILIIPLLFVLLNLESVEEEKGKGRGKIQKLEYLENVKSFLDEIKNILQFLKGYH